LSSGTEYGKYITFDKTRDKDIFCFFEEHSEFNEFIKDLKSRIKRIHNMVTIKTMVEKLNSLEEKVNTQIETT